MNEIIKLYMRFLKEQNKIDEFNNLRKIDIKCINNFLISFPPYKLCLYNKLTIKERIKWENLVLKELFKTNKRKIVDNFLKQENIKEQFYDYLLKHNKVKLHEVKNVKTLKNLHNIITKLFNDMELESIIIYSFNWNNTKEGANFFLILNDRYYNYLHKLLKYNNEI